MRIALGLFFVAFPLVELALLIRTGQLIGVWPTLAIVIVTAIAGGIILHRQGFVMVGRVTEAIEQGEPVVGPAVDGIFVFFAGALLIAPGLITDAFGLLLLIPPFRRRIGRWTLNTLMASPHVHIRVFTRRGHRSGPKTSSSNRSGGGPIIEGEFEEVKEKPANPPLPQSRGGNQER